MGSSGEGSPTDQNIDNRAYESLKARWIQDCVWDSEWSYLPGPSRRHGRPRRYPLDHDQRAEDEAAENSAAALVEKSSLFRLYYVCSHDGYRLRRL